ncbi:MAG: ornithine carbamoyltransferase [Deltaproteobacteria bacterium]|nr:ornithine carbamoyltransferase [Deltaproteobacteria bacterium]
MAWKDLTSLHKLSVAQLEEILSLSVEIKRHPERYRSALAHQTLALIFMKPSTRTRVSFQTGMFQLGGHALAMGQNELQIGRGESVADTARVLSRYVNGIVARVFSHDDIEQLAKYASVPVINGLSDLLHPCQAICDYLTMRERFGDIRGLPVTYVGDGNNVAHSLAFGAAKLGVHLTLATPEGRYQCDAQILAQAREDAKATGARIDVVHDPVRGVQGAKVVYADVWTSMGQEAESAQRLRDLHDYQINAALFGKADKDAIFMHCLPAHRGEEVTDEICDHPRSVIFDQAENRLHTQKAVLVLLMGRK